MVFEKQAYKWVTFNAWVAQNLVLPRALGDAKGGPTLS